jgi:hypothetical protein
MCGRACAVGQATRVLRETQVGRPRSHWHWGAGGLAEVNPGSTLSAGSQGAPRSHDTCGSRHPHRVGGNYCRINHGSQASGRDDSEHVALTTWSAPDVSNARAAGGQKKSGPGATICLLSRVACARNKLRRSPSGAASLWLSLGCAPSRTAGTTLNRKSPAVQAHRRLNPAI